MVREVSYQDFQSWREEGLALGLEAADPTYYDATDEEAWETFNGVGPIWMGAGLVDTLTRWFDVFVPAVVIHDWDYTMLPITAADRHRADSAFYANALKCIDLSDRNWASKLFWRMEAWRLYVALRVGGVSAFEDRGE